MVNTIVTGSLQSCMYNTAGCLRKWQIWSKAGTDDGV
jgi:hypothetical protein